MGSHRLLIGRISLLTASVCLIASGSALANAQSKSESPGAPNGAQIKVQEQQPKVNVQEPQPNVTVTQPKPQVTVTEQKPQVTVTQPKPNVQVQQAQPSVQVTHEGQPKVNVQEQGQPQVTVQREGQNTQPNQAQPSQQNHMQQAQQGIGGLAKNQIVGKTLYDSNNNEVGKIDKVQQGSGGNIQSAELDVGGFLGIGSKRVAISANDLQLKGDRLVAPSMTSDQIRNLPAANH